MALNASDEEIIAHRRELVARMRLRGLTQREITRGLPELQCVNPDSGEPWSLATVNSDLKALRTQWKREAQRATDQHIARQMAELAEVRRQAWEGNDLPSVLRAIGMEMSLLGTEAPKKSEVTGADGGSISIKVIEGPKDVR